MERQDGRGIIWVVGCQKCGNTWLSRLIAEALDCPIGGSWREDRQMFKTPPATEGLDRPGKYWIYQEHLTEEPRYEGQKIVVINRDPRDVIVSTMYYWGTDSLMDAVVKIIYKWKYMADFWIFQPRSDSYVTYEQLKDDTGGHLSRIIEEIGMEPVKRIDHVVKSQEFHNKRKYVKEHGDSMPHGTPLQMSLLRKGVVGDWKNHFTQRTARVVHNELFDYMNLFGYEHDPDWWKKI